MQATIPIPTLSSPGTSADGTTVEQYYTALGGRGTYPYTVILDENGVVIALFVEALEYEDLAEVVEAQLSK